LQTIFILFKVEEGSQGPSLKLCTMQLRLAMPLDM